MTNELIYERARKALLACFFFMGVPIGMLVPRLAEIKAATGGSNASYGTAIAIGGIGAFLGNLFGSKLVHHWGSKTVAQRTFFLLILANIANAIAPSVTWLAIVAFSSGLGYSMVNIAVNSQGVLIELGIGRSFLPMCHAFWSLGAMSVGLISSLIAPHVSPLHALLISAVVSTCGYYYSVQKLLPTAFDDRPHDDPSQLPAKTRIPRATLMFLFTIGFAQFFGLLAEISVGDWSSVLLHEGFKIPIGPNGYGYTTFMVVHLVSRLQAPRLIDRHGLNKVIRIMGVIGGIGYIVFLLLANHFHTHSGNLALILMCIAYGFMAFGVSSMPAAFSSAAGRIPGLPSARALFVTGGLMSVLNMVGRVTLATVANYISLPIVLAFMGVFVLISASMTKVLDQDQIEHHAIKR